jgi:hypothetical protein
MFHKMLTIIFGVKFFGILPAIILMIFNTSHSYFHKISFHYFKDSFNDELDPRVRHMHENKLVCHFHFSFPQMGFSCI